MELQIPNGKRHFQGDVCQLIVTYLSTSSFRIVRLPPLANVPAQRTWRTNTFVREGC